MSDGLQHLRARIQRLEEENLQLREWLDSLRVNLNTAIVSAEAGRIHAYEECARIAMYDHSCEPGIDEKQYPSFVGGRIHGKILDAMQRTRPNDRMA